MRKTPHVAFASVACALLFALSLTSVTSALATTSLQDATDRAVELQKSIESNRETVSAMNERIEAMELRLFRKKTELSDARERARVAYRRYRERLVSLYKSGGLSVVELLVESSSIRDLFYRTTLLSRLADSEREELVAARIAKSEAEYAASVVAEMKRELVEVRRERKKQLAGLERDLAEQRILIQRLDTAARRRVDQVSADSRISRSQWDSSSLPRGARPGLAKAIVDPYKQTYLVTTHQPRHYRSAGGKFSAVCSWYGNEFHGRRTASGQIFNENDFTCASRTLPFGTRLALSRAGKRIVVVVTDRGPFVHGRDLDLSKAAARALGIGGVSTVSAERVTVVR